MGVRTIKIHHLDEKTIMQIAAGEVIERPASVIKELIENSIDANSNRIDIRVVDGGKKEISVTDNGEGMVKEDLQLAFKRHATSKLQTIQDLDILHTLGFRGEALPSIASVSRVEVTTRTQEETTGTHGIWEEGRLLDLYPTAFSQGTKIQVKDLFFNLPARMKHLKATSTEFQKINALIYSFALAYPYIAFSLYHNDKLSLETHGTRLEDVLVNLFGNSTVEKLIPVNGELDGINLHGYIGKPELSRNTRNNQYLFVNGRQIYVGILSEIIKNAYKNLLMVHQHPMLILYLEVPAHLVDVNVHPSKMQVRFAQFDRIAAILNSSIRDALGSSPLIPKINLEEPKQFQQDYLPLKDKPSSYSLDIKESSLPPLIPLGQIGNTYIVCKGQEGLYLIDQHAAHERIYFDQLLENSRVLATQHLAVPIVVELTPSEYTLFEEFKETINDMGFNSEEFGSNSVIIREVPILFKNEANESVFLDLLQRLASLSTNITVTEGDMPLYAMAACKAAIKANDRLHTLEIEALLDQLGNTPNPYTCPHGRPTIVQLTLEELARLFKRTG